MGNCRVDGGYVVGRNCNGSEILSDISSWYYLLLNAGSGCLFDMSGQVVWPLGWNLTKSIPG